MASAAPTFPFTKETTNYARLCRLLVDVGSQVLRETFDRKHPPANLHTDLARPALHNVLQALRKKKVLNPTQWGKLYPAIKSSVSSRDFDITLLMVLLRNICVLVPPVTGWDNLPSAADVTPEADIARVKFYRNTVYGHASQASVDDAAFGIYWTEIRDALVRLGGADYGLAIDDLKDDCMDPDIEEHYQELLKQWKTDEENIQDKLDNMDKKLDDLKLSVASDDRSTPRKEPLDLKECQSQLCSHYNTMSQVKITPWDPDDTVDIDDIYTKLSWLKDERKPSGKLQRKLEDYTEMFEGHKRFSNPKRMLVYGRPGIGKSTFSQKIAVDWANGKNEILKKFNILLLIKLRDVCEIQDFPSILKASELLARDSSVSIDSLHEYVLQNQDKVLLVLDGYDEYSADNSSLIRKIWAGNQLRDCYVVVTTRQMEGEELVKSSHVQCEIRGLDSRKQVNEFASKFITDPKEIEEFDRYLDSRDLWEIAEIPLLLLMLCLIWMDRRRKALPKSRLEMHERFVETLLIHMTTKNPKDPKNKPSYNILDDYQEHLTEIGKLALDGLLRNNLYIDLKDANRHRRNFTDNMIRSGLFQVSKFTSGEPNESLFFLHKSVQEFLAAWYIMNEVGLKDGKVDCFTSIDSFQKAIHMQEILKFMCEWSEEGAKAVFSLLKFVGEKDELTECRFTKTPSMNDLSSNQINFRYLSLECLLRCSASAKQVVYPLFLASVDGVVLVESTLHVGKLAAENQLLSTTFPSYVFFGFEVDFAKVAPILDALHVVIVTCSGLRLEASDFFRKHGMTFQFRILRPFLKKERETMYLYFIDHISWTRFKSPLDFLVMLRDLTTITDLQKKQSVHDKSKGLEFTEGIGDTSDYKKNCLSLVSEIYWPWNNTSKELSVLSDVLSAVSFPRSVEVNQFWYRLFDAQVVKNMVSHINITDNLSILKLQRLNLTADDAAVIARSLHCAPNLHELALTDSPLHGSVSYLAENLRHVPRLLTLTLSRVGMGYQECVSLANSLKYVPKLKELYLFCNSLGKGIIKLAEHLENVPHLKKLGLSHTNMGEEEVAALAQAMKYVPELDTLYLGGNPLGRGVSVLVQHLSSLPNLSELSLKDVVMTKKELDDVTNAKRGNRKCAITSSYHERLVMASAAPTFPFTKETTNYARLCRLLVDVGSQVLRETFDRKHPPANLHTDLARPALHNVLQALRKKKVLNPTQWGKLYPAIKSSVSSRDFDITLLMVLLRNICVLVPPVTGWDNLPSAADVTPEADIARVKFYRNTVYGHASQASVDDAAFGIYWTEIRDALVRLGGADYGLAIDDLKDDCMDPDIEEHYQELLKQWKTDEENIQDKLDNMDKKLDDLKLSVASDDRSTPRKEPLDLKECQSQLCSHYNTMSQVKITPWDPDDTVDIDDIYTKLSWLKDERKPSGKLQRKLEDYTEMFEGHKRFSNPKRMLVYGRPGIGKSTFSQKIAVDWANGKNEILKKFNILLLIKLRDVCEIQDFPSILKASELLARDSSVSIDSLHEYVLQNQDKVLLVLDGYDEYSADNSSLIRKIWAGNQLRDCYVVVTTRQMEGEELVKSSHVQCEIRGLDSRKQVNEFASKFITDPKEIEEFDRYLDSRDLWEIAEIPLLLLMLCLIWMDRRRKALPKSRLEMHERFVETLLIHMTTKNPKDPKNKPSYNILDDYQEHLTEIGKLALDGLLRNNLYIDLKDANRHRRNFTDNMIRSGLFQVSKFTSGEPNESLFFLHKSVQEFLAAWYIMNEVGLKDGKVDCFTSIDSFQKAIHMQEILKFMCEWSEEGAKAVFSLLKFVGEKDELTECRFTKTPSMNDLSSNQINFRYLSLECLLRCSASAKQVVYPLFLASVDGVVLVESTLHVGKLAAENQLLSTTFPSYVFFGFEVDFAKVAPILDALHVVIVTCSGLRLEASDFFRKHGMTFQFRILRPFLKKERETMYLYFIDHISWTRFKSPLDFLVMLRDLTTITDLQKKQSVHDKSKGLEFTEGIGDTSDYKKNCLSLVSEIYWPWNNTSKELSVLSDVLSAVSFPRSVEVNQFWYRLFDAQVVKNMVSHINITDNLSILKLQRLNLTADDAAVIARSLHCAPNLHELALTDSPLHGSVSYLAENLRHVPRLLTLTLSRVGMGYQECVSLANSLKYVPKLKELYLFCNSLGKGIIKLAEHLENVPHLKKLGLSHTNMGEEEVAALAQAMKYVPELDTLYLGGNPLGRGVSVLVQHLSSLPNLSELSLKDVVMTKKELDDVTNAKRGNRKCAITSSYHDHQDNLKPTDKWPVIDPVPEWLVSPMRGSHHDGYF
ncbi:uncharacterized protein LOC144658034 [Oculina patagonica]